MMLVIKRKWKISRCIKIIQNMFIDNKKCLVKDIRAHLKKKLKCKF